MKHLLLVTLMSMSATAWSAKDWKVIAETTSCDEKIQVLGKDGEKYVLAVHGHEKTKLFAKDGSAFKEDSMNRTEFTSAKSSDVSYNFVQPSYVEANPPKIDVSYLGDKKRCKMELGM